MPTNAELYAAYERERPKHETDAQTYRALAVAFAKAEGRETPYSVDSIRGRVNKERQRGRAASAEQGTPAGTNADDDGEQWLRSAEIQDAIPDGHRLKGVSTLVDEQGKVRLQWIKTDLEQQQWHTIINAVLERIPQIITPLPPVRPTLIHANDLLALYPLADLHIGLYASLQDAERDWSLRDAVAMFQRCIDDLISRTPRAALAVLANLGDFTHTDNLINRTPKSAAPLDASGRFIEIAQAALELAAYAIGRVAEHHGFVNVIWQPGNHDEATSLVMQSALALLYRDDARIRVHQSGSRTHCIQHGRVAIGFTHGDTIKASALPLLMANDYPEIWAATRYRVWHTGHLHHKAVIDERVGCIVEVHQSPAPRDAWHQQQGYRSLHSLCSIVYNHVGEYARNTVQVHVPEQAAAQTAFSEAA